MLQRFRKKNMILDDVPDPKADNTIYPQVMSAEYLQGIQENTIFNHLGYNGKTKEAYGVVTVELEQETTNLEGPVDGSSFVGVGEGRVWGGTRSIQVNIDGTLSETDGTSVTEIDTGENNDKFSGIDSFTSAESYIVLLTIDQFIGVDFNQPDFTAFVAIGDQDRVQIQPLLNPDSEAAQYQFPANPLTRYRQASNRHDTAITNTHRPRETRSTFINMAVFEQTTTAFKLYVSRTNVFAEVVTGYTFPILETTVVPIHDYQRVGSRAGPNNQSQSKEHVIYVPTLDPNSSPTPITTVVFNRSNLESYARNFLRVAWYAKGV